MNKTNVKNMEPFEYFSNLKIPEGNYLVVRADGKTFHNITEKLRFGKPFDKRLISMMANAVINLMESNDFNIVLSYIQSDEISLVFKDSNIFNGRVEKLNSIIASYISVEFNKELMRNGFGQLINELNLTIIFDSRILVLPTLEFIMKYLLNRQRDCINNALHSYCFYLLVKNGNSPAQAERILRDMKTDGKKEMLRVKFEIIFDEIPPWQRLGTILSFERFRKQALNQKTQEPIEVTRKRILIRGADDYLQNSSILFNLLEQSFK